MAVANPFPGRHGSDPSQLGLPLQGRLQPGRQRGSWGGTKTVECNSHPDQVEVGLRPTQCGGRIGGVDQWRPHTRRAECRECILELLQLPPDPLRHSLICPGEMGKRALETESRVLPHPASQADRGLRPGPEAVHAGVELELDLGHRLLISGGPRRSVDLSLVAHGERDPGRDQRRQLFDRCRAQDEDGQANPGRAEV